MRPAVLTICPFTFHPLSKQVEKFFGGLSAHDWARFVAQAEQLAVAMSVGQPPAGRTVKVRGSSVLWEMKITPPGSKGPQARLLFAVDGKRVLCARGVDKRDRRLSRHDVVMAEREVAAYERAKKGERR